MSQTLREAAQAVVDALYRDELVNEIFALKAALAAPEPPCPDCEEMTKQRDHYRARCERLEEALEDAMAGLRYIRETHGDLYGVGFDRVEAKAADALRGK